MEQTLGKRIVQHRKRLGLTQEQLAEKLGVTAQAVSKWENDQSCPDISMLPKIAEIFGVSTDSLLGSEPTETVYQAEVVDQEKGGRDENKFEFSWNAGRKGSLSFALLVLTVGAQLILSKVMARDISFWNALWPSALLIFGIFNLFSKFSFVGVGSALFGAYFLLDRWQLLPFSLGGELVFPIILVVFGLSLLVDAFQKPRKPHFSVKHNGKSHGKRKNEYQINGESFEMSACFGEDKRFISMPLLRQGHVSTSFGDYTVDLSGVTTISENCTIDADCCFGELAILVPSHFAVEPTTSTAFGNVDINGHPDPVPVGTIAIHANASFGEISIHYI